MSETVSTKDIGRIGDMSPVARLRIGLDNDGDIYLSICDEQGEATIEFCTIGTGGGKSPNTRNALIALMKAIEAYNSSDPRRDWWLQRSNTAGGIND